MNVTPYLADWPEAVKRAAEGTLESTMIDDETGDFADWIQDLDWDWDSHATYIAAAEAWEAIRHCATRVPEDMGAKAQEFMNGLITHEGFFNDLETGREQIGISLSPETAERLTRLIADVDFNLYRDAYYANCDASDKERFSCDVESSFEDGFLPYIQAWIEAINTAASRKMGFLVMFT